MANFWEPWFPAVVRGEIRAGIRSGMSLTDVIRQATEFYRHIPQERIAAIAQQEQRRQDAVERFSSMPARRRTNLFALTGCSAGQRVQARFTIRYRDPRTQEDRTFGYTTLMGSQGTKQDLVNRVLREAAESRWGAKYEVPRLTSSQTSGRNSYRIEYLECVGPFDIDIPDNPNS
jgi:hypothetical protein